MANETQMFDKDGVVTAMGTIGDIFNNISTAYSTADGHMASELTTADGAMYGDGATKILAAWDENSGTLEDFMATFENWSALVSGMANQFTNLEEGTYQIKQDSPYSASELADRARAFHTTALKTGAGMTAFNKAQQEFYAAHPEMQGYDKNGVGYTSLKTLENGKIVETKFYTDENGNTIAEVEHWGWDEEAKAFVKTSDYYEGGEIKYDKTNNKYYYDNTGATKIDKDTFDEKYYSNEKNVETITENLRNKYLADYLKDGELSEEAQKELDKLPEDVRNKVMEELEAKKNAIVETNGERIYDENGRLVGIKYKGDDDREYAIVYDYDENGNITGHHYEVDGHETESKYFYDHLPNSGNGEEQTGSGVTGSDPTEPTVTVNSDYDNHTATYVSTDEDGNSKDYVLSQSENGTAQITVNGVTYNVTFNDDGTRSYSLGDMPITGKEADELDKAMNNLLTNDYAKGLAGVKEGNTQYGIDEKGNLTTDTNIEGEGGLPKGKLHITYDENGNPVDGKCSFEDENGHVYDISADEIAGFTQGEVDNGDGTTTTYSVDVKNGNVVKTTTKEDGKVVKEEVVDKKNNTVTVTENKYDDNNNVKESTTISKDADGNEIYSKTESYSLDEDGNVKGKVTKSSDGPDKYEYTDDKGNMVEVSPEEYKNLETGGEKINDNQYKEYSIKDGKYTETTHEGNDNKGRVVQTHTVDHSTGEEVTEDYGDANHPKNVTQRRTTNGDDYEKVEDFTYDTVGTKTGKTETVRDGEHNYSHTEDKDGNYLSGEYDGVSVDEEEYNNLREGSKESGNKTMNYRIENGEYVEETVVDNQVKSVRTSIKDKDGNSVHHITEEYDGTKVTSTKVDNVEVTTDQLRKIKDSVKDETNGVEYTINNDHFEEIHYKEDKISQVITEDTKGNQIKTTDYEYEGDHLKFTTETPTSKNSTTVRKEYYIGEGFEDGKVVKQETKTDSIRTIVTDYKEDGKTKTQEVVTSSSISLAGMHNPDWEGVDEQSYLTTTINGSKTTVYAEDGKTLISQTITNSDNSQTIENIYRDGKISEATITTANRKNTITYKNGIRSEKTNEKYDSRGKITEKTQEFYDSAGKRTGSEYHNYEADEYYIADKDYHYTSHRVHSDTGEVFEYKNGVVVEKPVWYENNDYVIDAKTIDQIGISGKTPTCVESALKDNDTYTTILGDYENHKNEVIVFKKGTEFQYDLAPGNDGYEINRKFDEGASFKIQGNKLVNVNDPNEYYYIDNIRGSKGDFSTSGYINDDERKSEWTYADLQKYREYYGSSASKEANLYDDEAMAANVVRGTYKESYIPENQGLTKMDPPTSVSVSVITSEPNAEEETTTLIENGKDLIERDYSNSENQRSLVWTVTIPNQQTAYNFTWGTVGNTECYNCTVGGITYVYDPKTNSIYSNER